MCVNWNEPQVSRLQLYKLVDANRVCQGIQKIKVELATRSVVATCYTPGRGKIVPRNVNNVINVNNVNK